ncbi:hypothetical protein LJC60_08805 [Ruminococcaceae bacterium OttesenSCG-928-D13]|nr:hypothetical protein [Ruminococcaceae bacterium OttesenSCG-928-D13]
METDDKLITFPGGETPEETTPDAPAPGDITLRPDDLPPQKVLLLAGDLGRFDPDRSLAELSALAEANHMEPVAEVVQKIDKPHPATVLGSGRLAEAKLLAHNLGCTAAIFDGELTGSQLRNLEDRLDLPVLDRTMLILEIFKSRAVTREGKTQTELATLEYRLPRLAGHGTSLSRQGGHPGGGAGPGAQGGQGVGEQPLVLQALGVGGVQVAVLLEGQPQGGQAAGVGKAGVQLLQKTFKMGVEIGAGSGGALHAREDDARDRVAARQGAQAFGQHFGVGRVLRGHGAGGKAQPRNLASRILRDVPARIGVYFKPELDALPGQAFAQDGQRVAGVAPGVLPGHPVHRGEDFIPPPDAQALLCLEQQGVDLVFAGKGHGPGEVFPQGGLGGVFGGRKAQGAHRAGHGVGLRSFAEHRQALVAAHGKEGDDGAGGKQQHQQQDEKQLARRPAPRFFIMHTDPPEKSGKL